MSGFDSIIENQIQIIITVDARDYKSERAYLFVMETDPWINIFAKWQNDNIIGLYLVFQNKDKNYRQIVCEYSISELGLYDNLGCNAKVEEFLNKCVDEYKRQEKEMNLKLVRDVKDLVLKAKNVILTGAPGTGKTYMAKDIAAKIITGDDAKTYKDIEKDEELKKQIGFVQFHPSYDYTDFVEGLRPITHREQILFKREDGVLKIFCKQVLDFDFNHGYDRFYEDLKNNKLKDHIFKTSSKEKSFNIIAGNEVNKSISVITELNKSNGQIILTKDNIFNYEKTGQSVNSPNSVKPYAPDIIEYIKSNYCKSFVLIIDEINRGEVSKIFGELFYSIDPGYRGENGRIATQYQNLVEDGDEFKDGFYVPDNVYIIGTMNDIDRSVESMDFALRRRFAFKEIKASETQNMLDSILNGDGILEEVEDRMKRINKQIVDTDGLNDSYCIGASYFGKLKDYNGSNQERFSKLWQYNIEPLVREYLRGIDDDGSKFEKIKNSYFNSQENDN